MFTIEHVNDYTLTSKKLIATNIIIFNYDTDRNALLWRLIHAYNRT